MSRFPTNSIGASYANWQKQARRQARVTQEELSDLAGVDQTTLSKYERRRSKPQNPDIVKVIANSLYIGDRRDEREYRTFIDAALTAAGYAREGLEPEIEQKKELVWQAYQGTQGPVRDAANALLGLRDDLTGEELSVDDIARITGQDGDDSGTIGKRAK